MTKRKEFSKDFPERNPGHLSKKVAEEVQQKNKDKVSVDELKLIRYRAQRNLIDYAMLMRSDYVPNWHHDLIASKLEAVERGEIKRLIISTAPRHGKSAIVSELFTSWFLGRNPHKEVVATSYSAELAEDFGRKAKELVGDPVYYGLFNTKVSKSKRSASKWAVVNDGHFSGGMVADGDYRVSGGTFTSVGIGGALTGRGADIAIIDDPFKNREEAESQRIRNSVYDWYRSVLVTRLSPAGAIVIICTRWHLDDLVGRVLANAKETGEEWDVINLPAIATEEDEHRKEGEALWKDRFSLDRLNEIRNSIGFYEFACLYQGSPITKETQVFKPEFFKNREEHDLDGKKTNRFLSIDPAVGTSEIHDYTGFCDNRVDSDGFWNIKAWHTRLGPKELIQTIFDLHQINGYDLIGIERTVYEMALRPFINEEMVRRNKYIPIIPLRHLTRSKVGRIGDLLVRYEQGRIFHVGDNRDLEDELESFPAGAHDDIIDAEQYQIQMVDEGVRRGSKELEASVPEIPSYD